APLAVIPSCRPPSTATVGAMPRRRRSPAPRCSSRGQTRPAPWRTRSSRASTPARSVPTSSGPPASSKRRAMSRSPRRPPPPMTPMAKRVRPPTPRRTPHPGRRTMMPEDHGEVGCSGAAADSEAAAGSDPGEDSDAAECSDAAEGSGVAERSAETEGPVESETAAAERRARLEAAKRSYRATLRNEADTGGGGFSEDYYRSQKPPHWS